MQTNKPVSIVLLSLSMFHFPVPVQAVTEWASLYRTGEEKLKEGQIDDAQRLLARALSAAQTSLAVPEELAVIHDAVGRTWFRAGRFLQAATSFEKALKLSAQPAARVPILCNAAQSYREAGDSKKSEKHLREALKLSPEEPHAWRLLGSVLIRQRRFAEAEVAEKKAFSFGDPTIAVAVLGDLAMIHEARGNNAESANDLRAAIALAQPGNERARLLGNLGAAELKLGRTGEGLVHLQNSLEEMEAAVGPRHPDLAGILELYSTALLAARRKPEAQQAALRAREIRDLLNSIVDWRELKN
jgi:tetratricopeptide (TPR) repeat protein